MQTKKKILVKNASREHPNHRFCRQQKKVTLITERKVAELITSSAKKQKHVGILTSKNKVAQGAKNLNTSYGLSHVDKEGIDEKEDIVVSFDSSSDRKPSDDKAAQCVPETIFSPTFHLTKDASGGMSDKGDFTDLFRTRDQVGHQDHAVENLKIDASNYHATLENQQNSIESRTNVTSTCACDTNTDAMTRSSEDPDKLENHSHMPHMKLNNAISCRDKEYTVLENLSSEVSAIYLAMQHSKLECVDEPSHDSVSMEGCVESDEDDEFDDFDPYLFIKNLPNLSTIVPTFRPTLLPKQTRSCPSTTLVLDLDETLVHSTLEPCEDADFTFPVNFNLKEHTIYVRCRPFLKDFMERVANLFEIIIFTASQSIYAEQLLNILDPKRKLFRHRVYRESCVYVDGNYLKDLSVLGRDLARVIIVDNSPQAFGFQVDNGIPIESWFDDRRDRELLSMLPFLESLVGVEDVRPLIAKKFNLRGKVAAAACLSRNINEWAVTLSKG